MNLPWTLSGEHPINDFYKFCKHKLVSILFAHRTKDKLAS